MRLKPATSVDTKEELFPSTLEFEGDTLPNFHKAAADSFVKGLKEAFAKDTDEIFVNKEDIITPENLKEYLDKNVKDKKLRAEIDEYIEQIEIVDDKDKYLGMFGVNDVKDAILEVYVRDEQTKALAQLTQFWTKDTTKNFTIQFPYTLPS